MKLKPLRRSAGLLLVIDGVRAFLRPAGYLRQLRCGIALLDDVLEYFAENPELTRKISAAEIALGLWLAVE